MSVMTAILALATAMAAKLKGSEETEFELRKEIEELKAERERIVDGWRGLAAHHERQAAIWRDRALLRYLNWPEGAVGAPRYVDDRQMLAQQQMLATGWRDCTCVPGRAMALRPEWLLGAGAVSEG
jgi:hypothetical protein